MTVGILALQGAFQKHIQSLSKLDVDYKLIRYNKDFDYINSLILPGGESTSISKAISSNHISISLDKFISKKPVFATCAGLIMLAKNIYNDSASNVKVKSFPYLNIDIDRNGWGRQIKSFSKDIYIDCINKKINGIFIRAPKIKKINDKSINVLASVDGSPVMIQKDNILATTFHPELTSNLIIHEYFLKNFKNND